MIKNKQQPYTYTMKTAGVIGQPFCTNKLYLYLTPPENALSIENLKIHIRLKFDAGIPAGLQKITSIGIQNSLDNLATPTHKRFVTVDQSADGDRVIDMKMTLTSLLKKDNVEFWPGGESDYPDATNYIYFELPEEIIDYYVTPAFTALGEVHIWKADGLFTIKEIR